MTQKIPFLITSQEYLSEKKTIDASVRKVLESGQYILGGEVNRFEQEFASYLGANFCVGVACGTDALTIAINALGIGKGDEVIIPANSYPTAFGIARTQAKIRLADIDPDTYTIDPKDVEKRITRKTKAIVAVHMYGNPCNLDALLSLKKKYKLFLIEDAAQAHGAMYKGKKIGTFGDIACFSFYPTKNLGAFGDAGAIVTGNKKLADLAAQIRTYGERKKYGSIRMGINSRLDELQAAVLLIKLKSLSKKNEKRQILAKRYDKGLYGLPLILPKTTDKGSHVFHLYVIRTKKRNSLQVHLQKNGITTLIHYPQPVHVTPSFSYLGYFPGDFPVAEETSKTVLSLPGHPFLLISQVDIICKVIRDYLQ